MQTYVDAIGLNQWREGEIRAHRRLNDVHRQVRIEPVGIGDEWKRGFEVRVLLGQFSVDLIEFLQDKRERTFCASCEPNEPFSS